MNVKKIVLKAGEELPEVCWECDACQGISPDYLYCLVKHIDVDAHSTRPDWCPLVVDECCEWVSPTNNPYRDLYIPLCNEDKTFEIESINDFHYCPSCGKRIKYMWRWSDVL